MSYLRVVTEVPAPVECDRHHMSMEERNVVNTAKALARAKRRGYGTVARWVKLLAGAVERLEAAEKRERESKR
jgi:hypothetical protein